ncbi:alpha-(1,3)-fucosyltransferase C [Trichonephila inaurata madagascariensis]|uniref:Fucosyltransferase n=2 Tax=Trichonephila inaurata madagascariensis TaxID=2747483 RepID=A0A8X6YX04_9ARAC|nr:alpha-(1,3)-fucosyltransferase C [Trichonephila inaurata madagascariensis]GFY79479.1 alpha-(1,3)-fucosyltransferase C [Trichonephila inaurata madagascariensis]
MEKCPVLRRLPRRMVLCLHFTCAILGACALFTLYLESENAVVSTAPSDLTTTKFNYETDKLSSRFQEPYSNNGNIQVAKVVPPSWSWTSKDSIPSPTSANKLDSDTSAKNNSAIPSSHHHAVYYDKTKYIYLTSVSTTSTNRPPRVTYRTVKSTPQPKIETTCHSFSMQNSKLILLWTPFFGYWGYFPSENFQHCDCRNCEVTTDRSRLSESDAVIFHARDMSLSDLPSIRYPHQRWVFYCLESPPYSDFPGLQHMKNMFNWTMTYRTNSDIVTQYGTIKRNLPPRKVDMQSLLSSFTNKTKSVVWMSSHCPTDGGRESYVAELRKYIDVEVYGTCGSSICPPGETNKCLQEFSEKYKFFLAFENTICRDYITEKFFRTLKYNIIPVVFGGAVYDKFAPPTSYIDALSFKSPKHLAFFLSGVGKDFKLYSNYFRWRKDYSVRVNNRKECDLCTLLHRTDLKPSSYSNIRKWWVNESHCRTWKPKR